MVEYLLSKTPIKETESVLDAGSGKNKVWFNTLLNKDKYECEIEDGIDFLQWDKKVDWVIGNPPFRNNAPDGERINLVPQWIFKASEIANKGFAFLINAKSFSLFTTARLEKLKLKGFYLTKIIIVADKRWFGRYYYVLFTNDNNNFIEWNKQTF